MSLWECPSHGRIGPMACCGEAVRVEVAPSETILDVTFPWAICASCLAGQSPHEHWPVCAYCGHRNDNANAP